MVALLFPPEPGGLKTVGDVMTHRKDTVGFSGTDGMGEEIGEWRICVDKTPATAWAKRTLMIFFSQGWLETPDHLQEIFHLLWGQVTAGKQHPSLAFSRPCSSYSYQLA